MQLKALLQLFLAAGLWGLGFVASAWSINDYTATESVVYRFFLAAVVGYVFSAIFIKTESLFSKADFIKAAPAGIFLGLMQLTQTIGLETTTTGKSAFITSLYVIIVPLLGSLFFKRTNPFRNYIFALIALIGTALLVQTDFKHLNTGDLWTFACAFLAALHIIYTGFVSASVDQLFRFNTYQSAWAFVVVFPLIFVQKNIHFLSTDFKSIAGVLYLCVGSSLIAFYLQLKAQKHLSDTTVTMATLFESPFAAFFGYMILEQLLSAHQISGAILIMTASVLMIFFSRKQLKN
jgi:drug/metabolite transporter (DMT)-like permease